MKTEADLLVMLKNDLEIITDYMDRTAIAAKNAELTQYIKSSEVFITREGATLTEDAHDDGDAQLIVMYAAWLYRARKSQVDVAMPRFLRWNLNNRIHQQKVREALE